MALIIPINLDNKIVLIDDDDLVHMSWKYSAKKKGVNLHSYLHRLQFGRWFKRRNPKRRNFQARI